MKPSGPGLSFREALLQLAHTAQRTFFSHPSARRGVDAGQIKIEWADGRKLVLPPGATLDDAVAVLKALSRP